MASVQVGKPILRILLCRYRQLHLLLGLLRQVHTSFLQLSLQMFLVSNSTAPLRHVIGFPYLGLLRGLRPMQSISRKLTNSPLRGELRMVPKFT